MRVAGVLMLGITVILAWLVVMTIITSIGQKPAEAQTVSVRADDYSEIIETQMPRNVRCYSFKGARAGLSCVRD